MTDLEKKEYLETFKWIKVKRYVEKEPGDIDYQDEYFKLLEHHNKETEFLINEVRKLVEKS